MLRMLFVVGVLNLCYINGEFRIGYQSANAPDFYQDEEGMFICRYDARNLSDLQFSQISSFGMTFINPYNAARYIEFCATTLNPIPYVYIGWAPYATRRECENAIDFRNKGHVRDAMYILWQMEDVGTYFCTFKVGNGLDGYVNSVNSISVNELWVPPKEFELFMAPPSPLLDGEKFVIQCSWAPGRPEGDVKIFYNKEVNEETFIAKLGTITINATCIDRTHSNYQNGQGAQISKTFSILTLQNRPTAYTQDHSRFYKNELAVFNCHFNKTILLNTNRRLLALAVTNNNSEATFSLCSSVKIGDSDPLITKYGSSVSTQQCKVALNKSDPDKFGVLAVRFPLPHPGNYSCVTHDKTERRKPILNVDVLRVYPTKYTMSILYSNHSFYVGDIINPVCKGEGSFPESQFKYGYNSDVLNGSFIATLEDNGAWISCEDLIHGGYLRQQICVFPDLVGLKSRHHPDFYRGETSIIRCKFHIGSYGSDTIKGMGILEVNPNSIVEYFDFCEVQNNVGEARAIYGQYLTSDEKCEEVIDLVRRGHAAYLTVPWKVTEKITYSCAIEFAIANYVSQESLWKTIDKVLVEPTKLAMNVNFQQDIYAGEDVVINCKSEGGDPKPSFEYFVDDKSTRRVFKAFPKHNNENVTCIDSSHKNYFGANSPLVKQQRKLNIYYAIANRNFDTRDALQTEVVELRCLIHAHLPRQADFTYKWQKNGIEFLPTHSYRINVTYNLGDAMQCYWLCFVECTNKRVEVKPVVFTINWLEPPPTTPVTFPVTSTTTLFETTTSEPSTNTPSYTATTDMPNISTAISTMSTTTVSEHISKKVSKSTTANSIPPELTDVDGVTEDFTSSSQRTTSQPGSVSMSYHSNKTHLATTIPTVNLIQTTLERIMRETTKTGESATPQLVDSSYATPAIKPDQASNAVHLCAKKFVIVVVVSILMLI